MAPVRRSPLAKAVLAGSAVAWLSQPAFTAAPATELRAVTAQAAGVRGARGFGSSAGLAGGRFAQRQGATSAAAGPELLGELGAELGGTAAGLAALYAIMSLNEYVYHRYFQHLGINRLDITRWVRKTFDLSTYRGDGHVEHHRETLDDMTLDAQMVIETPNEDHPWRGTEFPWRATFQMTSAVLIQAYPVLSLLGWSGPVIVATVVAALLFHAAVWNTLHPNMHGLPDVPLSHGVPSCLPEWRDSALFKWLRANHEGHHRIDGAEGNYNVCCPLMDQVVGTYVGEIKMKEVSLKEVSLEALPKVPVSA